MPVLYTPDVETVDEDETQLAAELAETLIGISRKTAGDTGQGLRSVHAKSHGLLVGELTIAEDLPPELAQGLFAHRGQYPLVMRFSTTPGDVLPDKVSTPHGLAIKILNVEGARVTGSETDTTQDFVMVNGPAFQTNNARAFLNSLKLLALTTDRAEAAKVALSSVLRNTEKIVEAFGGKSTPIRALGGEVPRHPAGEIYYTQVPVRYGDYIAKLSIVPASDNVRALREVKIDVGGKDLILRETMIETFRHQGGAWELRVQLCENLEDMPVEDAAKVWDEAISPFYTVARLTVPAQSAWSEVKSQAIDHGMAFNPWHALAAHRPLGSIMRLRQAAYVASSTFRRQTDGRALAEPSNLDALQPEFAG
ncbi:catalase family protein [Asticcacaulis sp. YBE204]|uniref:catalase family protein n=1 Tax=Asticcacaulis sp. YBE204 TaxID=1282363 RepID=UPI0003C3C581|nr:catalase family protein [Asticcacaulis sp. YBE204]ESQ77349.1 hypothetical protein AEYBE204_17640 [Asticcacaulis sp. YBE204]